MFKFQGEGEIIELIVRDGSGTKVDFFKFRMKETHKFRSILKLLGNKYGFKPFDRKDKDIDWLKKTKF